MPKKGSGKKKKSAGKKKPKADGPPPPPPKPRWPWTNDIRQWLGQDPQHQERMYDVFREHYLQGEGIICTPEQWLAAVRNYTLTSFTTPESELMLQMLLAILAREGSRTQRADDRTLMAAAMRMRHGQPHFERMYQELKKYFELTDNHPSVNALLNVFAPILKGASIDRATGLILNLGITSGKKLVAIESDVWDQSLLSENLMAGFQKFVESQQLRLVDLFFSLDKDRSGQLTREEFKHGLVMMKIPVDIERIEELIEQIDQDGDGNVDYKEFAKGRDDYIASLHGKPEEDPNAGAAGGGEFLMFDWDVFCELVVHCHYITRP